MLFWVSLPHVKLFHIFVQPTAPLPPFSSLKGGEKRRPGTKNILYILLLVQSTLCYRRGFKGGRKSQKSHFYLLFTLNLTQRLLWANKSCLTQIISAFWVCFYRCSPWCYQNSMRYESKGTSNLQKKWIQRMSDPLKLQVTIDQCCFHIETSQQIWIASLLPVFFCMIKTLTFNEIKHTPFIENK